MRCPEGCTCGKHTRPNRLTDEQRQSAVEKKRARDREHASRFRANNPEAVHVRNVTDGWRYALKHKYGINAEQWQTMRDAQNGCCYLCIEPLVDGHIHVDHDHSCCRGSKSCGYCIRGLACRKCNQGIGQFGDDPDRLRRVADNLEMANRAIRGREASRVDDLRGAILATR